MRLAISALGLLIGTAATAQDTPPTPAKPPVTKRAATPSPAGAAPDAGLPKAALLPRKPRVPAIGQLGTSKEDETSEPPAPRGAHPHAWEYSQASEADTALLRGLLYAYEPAPEEI